MNSDTRDEQWLHVEQLLSDIEWKATHLVIDDEEAVEAGVTGYSPDDENYGLSQGEAWEQVKPMIHAERERVYLDKRKGEFQQKIRDAVVTRWVKTNTDIRNEFEIRRLCTMVDTLLRFDRQDELREYLRNVLRSSSKVADKELKRKRRHKWGWLVYTYVSLRGVLYVAGVLAIFTIADNKFQRALFSIIVMIGNMLLTNRANDELYRTRLGFSLDGRFEIARRFFKFPEDESDREERMESIRDVERRAAAGQVSYYITIGFELIVWIICIVELVMALLS